MQKNIIRNSKQLGIFASGNKSGGGFGARELIENSLTGMLQAEITVLVSNHENGGVRKIADEYGIPFELFKGPYIAEEYQKIVEKYNLDFVSLSGWLKLALGLDPKKSINIHPGSLPKFGGARMYGHFVHEAIWEAFQKGEVKKTEVTMHFVTEIYDDGPVIFRYPVWIRKDDTPETIAERVNKIEHGWQSYITNLVVQGKISWDGENPDSLVVPENYNFHISK